MASISTTGKIASTSSMAISSTGKIASTSTDISLTETQEQKDIRLEKIREYISKKPIYQNWRKKR